MNEEVTSNACARDRKPRVVYSDDLLTDILDRIANGESLNKICTSDEMPSRKAFFDWVAKDETIKTQYEMAILLRTDVMAEEILAIADDGTRDTYTDKDGREVTNHDVIARSRLRVDARKWLASKMAPKKYGDKLELGSDPEKPFIVKIEREIIDAPPNKNS